MAISNLKSVSAKSTTIIVLGVCLAAVGKTTLIVDMDGRGRMYEGFGIPALSYEHDISDVPEGI